MLKKNSLPFILAVALILPPTVIALVNWIENSGHALPVFHPPQGTLPDFHFTDQNNEAFTLRQWKGKIVVANFFFTRCPVVCPKMMANLQAVKAAFPEHRQLLFSSFSVDPERDSVQELKEFARRFNINGNWHLLTGAKPVIYHLARRAFFVASGEGDGDAEDFIHSEKLVLIDRHMKIRGYYNGTSAASAQQLIKDIKKLNDEK